VKLDPIIHTPTRLQIIALLAVLLEVVGESLPSRER
jgi:hypothetical protein